MVVGRPFTFRILIKGVTLRVLVVGASGIIGRAFVAVLQSKHEIVPATRGSTAIRVNMTPIDSIQAMHRAVSAIDAVVCAAGEARFRPLPQLSDDDFQFSLINKLMGQVNLVRLGFDFVNDHSSFTLTSGVLAKLPMTGSAAVSLVNGGLEGFVRAAALEAPRGI